MKNLLTELKRITHHYYYFNIGKSLPQEPYFSYVYEGKLDAITKKHGMKKGNRKK